MKTIILLLMSTTVALATPTLYNAKGDPLSVQLIFHRRDGGTWIQDVNTNDHQYIIHGGPEVVSLDAWADFDNIYCGFAAEPQVANPSDPKTWLNMKLQGTTTIFEPYTGSTEYPTIGMIECCIGPCPTCAQDPTHWCSESPVPQGRGKE
ncbi:hypothetical protein N431DRAFT_325735 [Stipitochalara longipes BDJ]|nr:hypothetical protein N431DRAFT_325735 [Stipitochalara longipes BDJ]